jgi:carnosine N-methyltransferase
VDILITILFVTVCVSSAWITEGFSMCGGDFIEVYSDPNQKGRGNYLKLYFFRICYAILVALKRKPKVLVF